MSSPHPGSSHAVDPPPPPPPPGTSLPLPQAHTLLTSFTAFLTVAVHNLLFYRALYPPATFLTARAFNLPVHQNRHPRVCAWVRDAVDAVAAQLAGGNVERVAVVIHAPLKKQGDGGGGSGVAALPPGAVLERWMFDVARFPAWPGGADAMRDYGNALAGRRQVEAEEAEEEPAAALVGEGAVGEPEPALPASQNDAAAAVNWVDVDEQLRGAMRRLASAAERMSPLPEGCTFTVAVELREEGQAPIGHPQPWIPSEPNLQPASKVRPHNGVDIGGTTTIPIRAVEAGPLFFECWVEEGKAKEALNKSNSEKTTQTSSS